MLRKKSSIVVLLFCTASAVVSAATPVGDQLKEILSMWGKSYRDTTKASCPKGSVQLQKKSNESSFAIECKLADGLTVVVEGSVWVANRMYFENDKFSGCTSESEVRKYLAQFGGQLRIQYESDIKKYSFMLQDRVLGENKREMFSFINGFCMGNSFYAESRTKYEDQFKSLRPEWRK